MIPLILIALGLGAALTVYELSPRTRVRVDDYARAIRAAHAAHRAADTHLHNARAATATAARHAQQVDAAARQEWPTPPTPPAPTPAPTAPTPAPTALPPSSFWDFAGSLAKAAQSAIDAAVEHVAAATEANQTAAKGTADAAKNAQTEAQRNAAAESATKVLEREKKIAADLANLGVGECGVRTYVPVTPQVKDALIAKLRAAGMIVTGNNPWSIDPKQAGVKLRAVWDPMKSELKLIVTSKGFGWCSIIWERIEPKLRELKLREVK